MRGYLLIALGTLAFAGCPSHPRYVVRLDLDRIAAQTAVNDRQPGFTLLPTHAQGA